MRNLLLVFLFLFSISLVAEDTPRVMMKIVVQMDGPDIPQDAFIRKPKVIYRAGNRYCRVEEAPDPDHEIQRLLVVNEPDTWMVNLTTKSGQHVVDSGPWFNCRLPIFSGPLPGTAYSTDYLKLGLEFGHELEFFKKMGATPRPGPVLQTKETISYSIEIGGTKIALFTYGPDENPLLVGRTNGKKGELYWYSGYGSVPFDTRLFAKPEGIKIEEQKPRAE